MAAGASGPHFGTIIRECEEHSVIPSAVCRTFVLSSALFQSSSTHTFWQKETAQNPWRSKLLQIFSVSSAANLQTLAAIQGKSELAFFTPFQSCPAPTKKTVWKSTFWSTWVRQTRLDEIAVVPVEPREVQTSIQIINVTGNCRACQMWDILKYKGSFVQYFQVSVESVSIQKIMWLNRDLQWLLWGCTCVARFCCPLSSRAFTSLWDIPRKVPSGTLGLNGVNSGVICVPSWILILPTVSLVGTCVRWSWFPYKPGWHPANRLCPANIHDLYLPPRCSWGGSGECCRTLLCVTSNVTLMPATCLRWCENDIAYSLSVWAN